MESYTPLFLLGLMRSGTTYFRNVLSDNCFIQVMGSEMNSFWTEVGKAPSGLVKLNPYLTIDDTSAEVISDVRAHYDGRYKTRNSPNRVLFRTYRKIKNGNETIFKNGNPHYLLNKSTHLTNKIGYLNTVFPEAKYIVLVRDIYSQSCSLYFHLEKLRKQGYCISFSKDYREGISFTEGHQTEAIDFENVSKFWIDQNVLMLRELETHCPNRFKVIGYKDVVENIESVLKDLSAFLELNLNPLVDQKIINNYSSDPLYDWKKKLTKAQIEAVQRIEVAYKMQIKIIDKHLESRVK